MAEEVTPITITVESAVVEAALDRLARAARDLRPAMRDIGGLLEKETDDNFRAQGRPHWKPLSQATILNRLMGKDREGRSKGISSVLRKDGDLRHPSGHGSASQQHPRPLGQGFRHHRFRPGIRGDPSVRGHGRSGEESPHPGPPLHSRGQGRQPVTGSRARRTGRHL